MAALGQAVQAARAGAAVVTSSNRLARSIRERYNAAQIAAGARVWPAPRILPFSAWLHELWDACLFGVDGPMPVRLGDAQARLVWEKAIAESPEADLLLDLPATADAAARSWELVHAWRLSTEELAAFAKEDTAAFLGWARRFEQLCAEGGWLEGARVPEYLSGRLPALPLPGRVALAGFDEFTPRQSAFFEACSACGVNIDVVGEPGRQAGSAVRVALPDSIAEIASAALWARGLLAAGERSIGVVIRNLSEVRPHVARIFSEVLEPGSVLPGGEAERRLFNISAAPALSAYPIVESALAALELAPGGNELALLSNLLRSRFLRGAQTEWTRRGLLDAEMRESGGTVVALSRVRELCARHRCALLGASLDRWSAARGRVPARQSPGAWARTFSHLLAELGWPGDGALTSAEYQAAETWKEALSEFASLETVAGAMTNGEAAARLRRMASERMFQPETGSAPVQILGVLEAAGMEFDRLWIAGLDDESLPGPAQPDPFLPVAVQRQRGLPHATPERELAFAQTVLQRLLASAPDIVVSWPQRVEDRDLGPSPLIRNIAAIEAGRLALPSAPRLADVVRNSAALETIADASAPATHDGVWQRGGAKVFQLQALCPFRAFAELRLGAEPLESPEPGLGARDRGTAVHIALETVWRNLRSLERLRACAPDELRTAVREAAAQAVETISGRRASPLAPAFAEIERARLERLLNAWLAYERGRQPFVVLEPEEERDVEVGGIRLRIKIDRIDRLADGREVVIDYKTGRPHLKNWDGDRPEEPQLPLYSITHEGPLAAVLFGQVRIGDIRFRGYASDGVVLPDADPVDLAAQNEQWSEALGRLAAAFRAGEAAVDPKNGGETCARCPLGPLCRVAESRPEVDGE